MFSASKKRFSTLLSFGYSQPLSFPSYAPFSHLDRFDNTQWSNKLLFNEYLMQLIHTFQVNSCLVASPNIPSSSVARSPSAKFKKNVSQNLFAQPRMIVHLKEYGLVGSAQNFLLRNSVLCQTNWPTGRLKDKLTNFAIYNLPQVNDIQCKKFAAILLIRHCSQVHNVSPRSLLVLSSISFVSCIETKIVCAELYVWLSCWM
jgi:hypothetical protein